MTTVSAPPITALVRFLLARVDEEKDALRALQRRYARGAASVRDE